METDGATVANRVAMRTGDDGSPLAVDAAMGVSWWVWGELRAIWVLS